MYSNIQKPSLLKGNSFSDERGKLTYNNGFDAKEVKRIYTLENVSTEYVRGWQGHKIEQRWFAAVKGSFIVKVKPVAAFENKDNTAPEYEFLLKEEALDYLHIPAGYVTAIQALEEGSKLILLSDYFLGEIDDEWRFDLN